MRGHVRKRGKTWTAIYDEGENEQGNRKQIWKGGFATKKDAEKFLRDTLGDIDEGRYVRPTDITLRQYLTEWVSSLGTNHEELTIAAYRSSVGGIDRQGVEQNGHVPEWLGNKRLQQVTYLDLERLYRELGEKGLAPATILRVHNVLNGALKEAIKGRLIYRNPASEAKNKPKLRKKRRTVWTARELRTFIEATESERLGAAWRFVALTGVRRGELLGLRWLDLDLEQGTAAITQTVIPTSGKRWRIKPTTKTDNPHTIALDVGTVTVLKKHRDAQRLERALWGDAYQDHDLVFARENGLPLDPNIFSETFAATVKRHKLPPIRLHDLRHTHATHLLAAGERVKVVSERLGHADIKITLNTYAHVMPADDAEAAKRAAGLLFGTDT